MSFDAFIKVDGIPGESTDDKHKDWIEVLSFSFGLSQPGSGSASTGGGRSAQRVDFQDFNFTHALDKAHPKLNLACANGQHIKEITMEVCRAVGDKTKYYEVKMSDVIVSSVQMGGSGSGSEALPTCQVGLNFGKIAWTYTETDHSTGKPKGDVKASWDLQANKGS